MSKHTPHLLRILSAGTILFAACTYNKGDEVNPVDCSTVIESVSFSADIQPILTTNCAIAACHSGTSPEGNLNLEELKAYAALSKPGSGYIDVNDPRSSVLYSSLVSASDPMPPIEQQPLDPCDIKKIEVWMQEGALDN